MTLMVLLPACKGELFQFLKSDAVFAGHLAAQSIDTREEVAVEGLDLSNHSSGEAFAFKGRT